MKNKTMLYVDYFGGLSLSYVHILSIIKQQVSENILLSFFQFTIFLCLLLSSGTYKVFINTYNSIIFNLLQYVRNPSSHDS